MDSWNRSRFQLTVHRTRNLKVSSKSGVHDIYVLVSFGKENHKTSVKERCIDAEWEEDCFLKLLSTNLETIVKVKVCRRNFSLLHDETLAGLDIQLKKHQFYEQPKQSWFTLKNKSQEFAGEILLTLSYLAITPAKHRPTLKKSNSFKSLADKLGQHLSIKKEFNSKNVSLTELSRKGTTNDVDLNIFTETFRDILKVDEDDDGEVTLRRSRHNSLHRHTIDFSAIGEDKLYDIDLSESIDTKRHSTPKLKTILVSDSCLTKFDSFDSLNDKKAFDDSRSSSENSISNQEILKLDDVSDNDDVSMNQLNRFSKQELLQMVKDQKEWIKEREIYIIDLHSYVNTLLTRILNSNCSILQKNCQNLPKVDGCHKLTTFKTQETSTPMKWIKSLFGQKQRN